MLNQTKFISFAACLLAAALTATPAYAQMSGNVLVNGDFEGDSVPNWGNNTGIIPTGWSLEPGTRGNVVKIDGPGGVAAWYASDSPVSDAAASGTGVTRHYFDTLGNGRLYQTFVPRCTGEVRFGGAFSGRVRPGRGSIAIRSGAGVNGPLIGQTNNVTVPSSVINPPSNPWTEVDVVTTLQAGETYSYVVTMTNDVNFDEAHLRFTTACDGHPSPGPIRNVIDGGSMSVRPIPNLNLIEYPPVPMGEHYQCYSLEKGKDVKDERIQILDQFGRSEVVLGRPVMLCNPSEKVHNGKTFKRIDEKRHLVCYNYRKQDRVEPQNLRIQTQFGNDEVVSSRREFFCAPAGKAHVERINGKP